MALLQSEWVTFAVPRHHSAGFGLAPGPPAPPDDPNAAVNINYVHGLSDVKAQTWMHPWLWLAALLIGLPACLYLPTHLVLIRAFPRRDLKPRTDDGPFMADEL